MPQNDDVALSNGYLKSYGMRYSIPNKTDPYVWHRSDLTVIKRPHELGGARNGV